MELIVPSLPVPMIVQAWEHVILQQEHVHAMLDVLERIVLWSVQETVKEKENVFMMKTQIQQVHDNDSCNQYINVWPEL